MAEPQRHYDPVHLPQPPPWISWLMAALAAALAALMTALMMAGNIDAERSASAAVRALLPVTGVAAGGGAVCWGVLMSLAHRRGAAGRSLPAMAYAVLVVPMTLLGAVSGAVAAWGMYSIMASLGPAEAGSSEPIAGVLPGLVLAGSVAGAMAVLMAHIGILLIVSHKMLKMVKCKLAEVDPATLNQRETQ